MHSLAIVTDTMDSMSKAQLMRAYADLCGELLTNKTLHFQAENINMKGEDPPQRRKDNEAFTMSTDTATIALFRWLKENAQYPMVSMEVFLSLWPFMDRATNTVVATRAELIEASHQNEKMFIAGMRDLVLSGVIGRTGRGETVRYSLNPRAVTKMPRNLRRTLVAKAPELTFEPREGVKKNKRGAPRTMIAAE